MPLLNEQENAAQCPLYSDAVNILSGYYLSFSYLVIGFIVLVFSRSHRIDPCSHPLLRNLLVARDRNQIEFSLIFPPKLTL